MSAFYWLVENDWELKGAKGLKIIGVKLKQADVLTCACTIKMVLQQYVTFLFAVSVGIITPNF
ncbi:MAG: hypothetical protein WCP96_02265 [Methylococcaceae bacterium]